MISVIRDLLVSLDKNEPKENDRTSKEVASERHDAKAQVESVNGIARSAAEVKDYRAKQHSSGESGVSRKHKLIPAKELLGDLAHQPQTKQSELKAKALEAYRAVYANTDSLVGKAKSALVDDAPYGAYKIHYEKTKQPDTNTLLYEVNLSTKPEAVENKLRSAADAKNDAVNDAESTKLARLQKATQDILVSATHRFGEEQIASLNVAKDDAGLATSALLLGPEICKMMGADEARKFGKRLIVFGVAPLLGMADEAKQQFTEHTTATLHEGSSNFLVGTALGAVLERCHPLILGTVTVGAGFVLFKDQVLSPENAARNKEIAAISSKVDEASNADLIKYSERTKTLIGPEIYHGAFAVATGGAGLPEGKILRQAAEEKVASGATKIKPDMLLGNFKDLGSKAIDSIASMFGTKQKWSLADGPLSAVTNAEKEQAEHLTMAMTGEARASWRAPIQTLAKELDHLNAANIDDLCRGLQAAQSDLIALNKEPVLQRSQVDALFNLEDKFQAHCLKLREKHADLKRQAEAIESKAQESWTDSEQKLIDDFYQIDDTIYSLTKERLEEIYRWDSKQAAQMDRTVAVNTGHGVQRRFNNALGDLLSQDISKNPEVIKVFQKYGVALERAKDWVAIPSQGSPIPAADHAKCDCLFVNKQTGEMYAFDVTEVCSGMRKGRFFDSRLTNPTLDTKAVASERQRWVIGCDETAILNFEADRIAAIKSSPEYRKMTNRQKEELGAIETLQEQQRQIAEIIAQTLLHPSKLDIFKTRLPSADSSVSLSRQIFEIELFRRDLLRLGFNGWASELSKTRDALKRRQPGLPYYDN